MVERERPLIATYRLQLRQGFGFTQVAELADYLAQLGISHAYLSPCLQAVPGSSHGYDVVDPTRVSRELGGEEGFAAMCQALTTRGIGIVLDFVPNHMAIDKHNPWWWDVLQHGPSSRYAAFFDVEWAPPEERPRNQLLLPVLGDHVGYVLDQGEIRFVREGGDFTLQYQEHVMPVAPRSLGAPLLKAAERVDSAELGFLADAFDELPLPTATDAASIERRHRDCAVLSRQLARLLGEDQTAVQALDAVIAEMNSDSQALGRFLEAQNFRLAFWRRSTQELSYRRFFDINSLVGLRVENARVFDEYHALIARWLREGTIDGVRVDHPDGLRDPETYLWKLRSLAPNAWLLVEKILSGAETLPSSWPVDGTTGYEFLNLVQRLLYWPKGEQRLDALYARFTGMDIRFAELARTCKQLVLREILGSDLNRLTASFLSVCEGHRHCSDYGRLELQTALEATLLALPQYRTYVRPDDGVALAEDVRVIEQAIEEAKRQSPEVDTRLFDFLKSVLTLKIKGDPERELVGRFQQLSGSVMAKGLEDTAFYRFTRLVGLNEVGGEPLQVGIALEDFHSACIKQQQRLPRAMSCTSTHDTKRSEDVRARLALLCEIPDRWEAAVRCWAELNLAARERANLDRNTEYLYYQTLVGAWPIESSRLKEYLLKATREAKDQTSWLHPNQAFEQRLSGFIDESLANQALVGSVQEFVDGLLEAALSNSLAQLTLKLTCPGVPDIYQGTELLDLSLVDPDNRRPVDFAARRLALEQCSTRAACETFSDPRGLAKQWLIQRLLGVRRERPAAFSATGSYVPVSSQGERAEHVVAFVRGGVVLTVVQRWPLCLAGQWHGTTLDLPQGQWQCLLSNKSFAGARSVSVIELLGDFPVAILTRIDLPESRPLETVSR